MSLVASLRTDPKRELWFAWYTTIVFYNFYFIVFFPVTHAQPPPHPYWSDTLVANWFGHNHHGLTLGPVTGRLLAEMMTGAQPFIDARPFRPERFG